MTLKSATLLENVSAAHPTKSATWCMDAILSGRVGLGDGTNPDTRATVTEASFVVTNPKAQLWMLIHQHEPVVVPPLTDRGQCRHHSPTA